MPTLDPTLRDLLATVIGKENADGGARAVAEAGARAGIEALAVHLTAPYAHLDVAGRQLRNRLRARARQLGDARHADGRHGIARLVEQAAYEHWHRMLFARFLAENDLLIHPGMKVAVTLDECAELAPSEGAVDGWELAGRYASRMLPQIFRPDDPLLALRFALDDVRKLEDLLDSLPSALFRASDSLGWCYQFWQARRKKEVNASEVKIGADELPAVTQLFTEPYMVQFLLHNTLGAWWVGAGRTLPVGMPYLRLLDDGTPAAGTFEGWPHLARELKVLDPCCGSGHFLVEAFLILVAFRMAEEGLDARDACDAVLRDNLFGLEIDARCVQIAAFALALAAWTYPGAGRYRPLPELHVACSGLAPQATRAAWLVLAGEDLRLKNGMERLYDLFEHAPYIGSLADPMEIGESGRQQVLGVASFDALRPLLAQAPRSGESQWQDEEEQELGVAAKGMLTAADLLCRRFHLVATNVPYLTRKKMGKRLLRFTEAFSQVGSADLATVFLERCRSLCTEGGCYATVTPLNWLSLGSYKQLRQVILRRQQLCLVALLGSGATATASWDVLRALSVVENRKCSPSRRVTLLVTDAADESGRGKYLRVGDLIESNGQQQLENPDYRIAPPSSEPGALLSEFCHAPRGIVSGDGARWTRLFWEPASWGTTWRPLQSTVSRTMAFGGRELVIYWAQGGRGMLRPGLDNPSYGCMGVAVTQTRSLPVTLYSGDLYDNNVCAVTPRDPADVAALWCFLSSPAYNDAVRRIDRKLNVTNATLSKVPFDVSRWRAVAAETFPHGLPAPHTGDATQWIFQGRPRSSDAPLHVAVARLLGYHWPDQQPDVLDALTDADGIVCIPAVRGERPAADRLTDVLAEAWGRDWHPQTLTDLLAAVGHPGTLEEWLRDAFFRQHCELFHHRPFIWHVWDGHREGFSALVNYHRLDHEGLKSLTWTYLGDWIRTQEIEAKAGKSGAGDKIAKARALQQRLSAILEGESAFDKKSGLDIFVRWKSAEDQPLGWHPDLDDGVRLNIRPFMTVADVGAKGAGVLRWKPNVSWGKDRGKNPPGSPWGEDRDNDKHLTLAEKRMAKGLT